jgi:hypothetical protein
MDLSSFCTSIRTEALAPSSRLTPQPELRLAGLRQLMWLSGVVAEVVIE